MAFASYSDPHRDSSSEGRSSVDLSTSRAMGKVYLYMGLALLITAAVAVGVGFLFAGWITNWTGTTLSTNYVNLNNAPFIVYLVVLIASLIGVLITGIAMHVVLARGRHSVWPTFIIYAILMGVVMSVFLIVGIDFATLGEAFAISAAAFLIMGLIGFFSKKNLNIFGMVALAALFMVILFGLVSLVLFFLFPGLLAIYSIIYNVVIMVVLLIMVAVDTYNIKKIMSTGSANQNLCLYCAYIMYSDFIHLLIRVIILLARAKRN